MILERRRGGKLPALSLRLVPLTFLCAITAGGGSGCAHIEVERERHVELRSEFPPVSLGSGAQVVERVPLARWEQHGDELWVDIEILQSCRELSFIPVTEVEHIERRDPQHALAWEFGIAGVMGGLSAFALIVPSRFGGRAVDAEGNLIVRPDAGYTAGGVFAGVAGIALVAGIVDAVRLRDRSSYIDAYRPELGSPCPCPEPRVRLIEREITLVSDGKQRRATTDALGRARFELPPAAQGPTRRRRAAVIVDPWLAVGVDYVEPFDAPAARGHRGAIGEEIEQETGEPEGSGPIPPESLPESPDASLPTTEGSEPHR